MQSRLKMEKKLFARLNDMHTLYRKFFQNYPHWSFVRSYQQETQTIDIPDPSNHGNGFLGNYYWLISIFENPIKSINLTV